MTSSFKSEVLGGIHDLDTDVIKIALYTSTAAWDATTTAYSVTNEITGVNYVAGGTQLLSPVISLDGTTGICDFADPVWAAATITARSAIVYNSSKANRAIVVLDFGADKTSTLGDYTIVLPAAAAATAVVRIA
jgi:hypothetical protein